MIHLLLPKSNIQLGEKMSYSQEALELGEKINGIMLYFKENTLTKTSAILILKDLNEEEYWYGRWYRIDKLSGEEWIPLEIINEDYYGFQEDAILPNQETGIIEFKLDWKLFYGELEDGRYRIVKDYCDTEIYLEFDI